MAWDFSTEPEFQAHLDWIRALVREEIEPLDVLFPGTGAPYDRRNPTTRAILRPLQERVKKRGLFACHLRPELGGQGYGQLKLALMYEILGRSNWAPSAFGCQAPDSGNAEILHQFGSEEQKARWLKPLVNGDIRSCFSMTEPEVSGSDPTGLQTRAVRDGDEWVINGHKWFTSGAIGASFAIAMVVTDPDASEHRRMSQIIVPTDSPGFDLVRAVPVMGETGAHCEIYYRDCRVPVTNTLGQPGDGFLIAQKRLGPGRIHHCMRWLGQMQRAFELMCNYSLKRVTFGTTLAQKQTVQNWIADSAAEIQAARLLTLHAAHKIDSEGDPRVEISLIKFFGAKVLHDVIDRAIQTHGALGVSGDTPLEFMYRQARAARIYDGPDEVHRMVVARRILQSFSQGVNYSFE